MSYQSQFWTSYFKYYDVLLELIPYQNLQKELVQGLSIKKDEEILDLGCGTANILSFIHKPISYTGIDNSNEALERAHLKFSNITTVNASITEKLPFADNQFDKIVTNNVLYTIPRSNWHTVINECKRILKPNGIIVISNLKECFNPFSIYKSHVHTQIREVGFWLTLKSIVRLIIPTFQIFRFNRIISASNNAGTYHFITKDDHSKAFTQRGFKQIRHPKSVYADQAQLDIFLKV